MDELFLADDDLADLRHERLNPLARLLNLIVCLLCKNTHGKYQKDLTRYLQPETADLKGRSFFIRAPDKVPHRRNRPPLGHHSAFDRPIHDRFQSCHSP